MSIPVGIPQFDELYVISDLHLGGSAGFQIFNSGSEAERLIQHLRNSPTEKKIALVINGDLVDFLAERPAQHFDPLGAVDKLDRIAGDPSFAPLWKALQKFVATKNRYLIITLGNHDLELALPWVRAHLLQLLSQGNESSYGRIVLSFDGSGFLCKVGSAEILCVHGNEVDDWNVTDHEKIRRIGRDLIQGKTVESWIPNAGTQLVIDVMNHLKSSFPFIDLLKPELQGVIPTLLALAPDQRDKIRAIAGTAQRLLLDKIRRATGFLGAAEEPPAEAARMAAIQSTQLPGIDTQRYAAELLLEAEDRKTRGVDPMSLIPSDQQAGYLGGAGAVRSFFRGESTSEVLREALENLQKDRSFAPETEDDTFKRLDELVGNVDFVVAGHTHLERALRRKRGNGWYFNSGTWVRLIRLGPDVLNDKARFERVFDTFRSGRMQDLDAFPNLVVRRLTVVAFWADGDGSHGELRRAGLSAADPVLSPVSGRPFTRS